MTKSSTPFSTLSLIYSKYLFLIALIIIAPFPLLTFTAFSFNSLLIPVILLLWTLSVRFDLHLLTTTGKPIRGLGTLIGALAWTPTLLTLDIFYDVCRMTSTFSWNLLCLSPGTVTGLYVRRLAVFFIVLGLSWLTGKILERVFLQGEENKQTIIKNYTSLIWLFFVIGVVSFMFLRFSSLPLPHQSMSF